MMRMLGLISLAALAVIRSVWAQGMPSATVEFTPAQEHALQRDVQMTGTVAARLTATVAAEVSGAVAQLRVSEGDRVEKGQVLVALRSEALRHRVAAAQASVENLRAQLKQADLEWDRARGLFDTQVISSQTRDQALYRFESLAGQERQAVAQLAEAKLALDRAQIKAPFAGVVTRKHVQPGEWVAIGGPTVSVLAVQQFDVWVDVPERYFPLLRVGDAADITLPAFDNRLVAGRITATVPQAGPSRTLPVRITFNNSDGQVPAGILANVAFRIGETYTAVIVPKDAVITEGSTSRVFVMQDDQTVQPVMVTLGPGTGQWVAVDGLQPGQRVVTLGNERLMPGQSVQGQAREYDLP